MFEPLPKGAQTGEGRDLPTAASTGAGKRLSRREYVLLLSELDRAAGPRMPASGAANRRQYQRMPFHGDVALRVHSGEAETEPAHYLLRCRNLSRRGISFLHHLDMTIGTCCTLQWIALDGSALSAEGTIARCSPVAEGVFEIGIRFNWLVDTASLMRQGPATVASLQEERDRRAVI